MHFVYVFCSHLGVNRSNYGLVIILMVEIDIAVVVVVESAYHELYIIWQTVKVEYNSYMADR